MKKYFLTFALIVFFLPAFNAAATSVLPISLEQLSMRASLIFHAEVISNQVKRDTQSRQIATYTEFKIIDAIKGSIGTTHTIKQIGGQLENSNVALKIHGVPSFQVGKDYVVFLPAKSTLGFSSPLGLHQGSFSVSIVDGEQVVSNGNNLTKQAASQSKINNSNIRVPLAVKAGDATQSRLDDFINTVRAFNAQ